MNAQVVDAHAKVNLFLRVGGVRPDGYHDLSSLLAPISLADQVTVTPSDRLEVQVAWGSGRPEADVGPPERNLALLAALAFAEATGTLQPVRIDIVKSIPAAAGLGGGSADAAATLRALNQLHDLPLTIDQLVDVAAEVGSDVPALVYRGPVVVAGRGERVRPARVPSAWWVLVPSEHEVRTPIAFSWWDEAGQPHDDGDPETVLQAASDGDLPRLGAELFNDLHGPVVAQHPDLAATMALLSDLGALGEVMCGSGGTVAGLVDSQRAAEAIAAQIPGALVASMGEQTAPMPSGDNQGRSGVV